MTSESERFLHDLAGLRPQGVQGREALDILVERTGLLRETIERVWARELLSWEVTAVYAHACGETTSGWLSGWEKAARERKWRVIGCFPDITGTFPDPGRAEDLKGLRLLMDEMRDRVLRLSYETLDRRSNPSKQGHSPHVFPYSHLSRTTLNNKMRGNAPLDAAIVEAFAAACGLPRIEARRWGRAYQEITTAPPPVSPSPPPPPPPSATPPTLPPSPSPSATPSPSPPMSRRGFWRWTGGLAAIGGVIAAETYRQVSDSPPPIEIMIVRTLGGSLRHEPADSSDDQDGQAKLETTYSIAVNELDEEVIGKLAGSKQPWYMDVILYLSHSRTERLSNYSYYGNITYRVVPRDGRDLKGESRSLNRAQKAVQLQDIALGTLPSDLRDLEVVIGFDCTVTFPSRTPQARNKNFDLLINPGEIIFHNQPFTEAGRQAAPVSGLGTPALVAATPPPLSVPMIKRGRTAENRGRLLRVSLGRKASDDRIYQFEKALINEITLRLSEKYGILSSPKVIEPDENLWTKGFEGREQMLLRPYRADDPQQVDMLMGTYSITERRRDRMLFAGPYLITEQAVLVRADRHDLKHFDDIRNVRLGYREDSTPYERLKTRFGERWAKNEKNKSLYDYQRGIEEIIAKDGIEAVSTDRAILVVSAGKVDPGAERLKLIDGPPSSEEWGIGLHPRHPYIDAGELNAILKQLIAEKWWEQKVREHFGTLILPGSGRDKYLSDELLGNRPVIP
ncbi:substrate-binding periplasmic protein [Streptosporangium sp. NPDC004631]